MVHGEGLLCNRLLKRRGSTTRAALTDMQVLALAQAGPRPVRAGTPPPHLLPLDVAIVAHDGALALAARVQGAAREGRQRQLRGW